MTDYFQKLREEFFNCWITRDLKVIEFLNYHPEDCKSYEVHKIDNSRPQDD